MSLFPKDDLATYLFHQGTHFSVYNYMGAHFHENGVVFRTWAPNAQKVCVMGEFNFWNSTQYPMERITDSGIWEGFVEGVGEYASYKFAVTGPDGKTVDKADPYAFHAETRPLTASKVFNLDGFVWNDEDWLQRRANTSVYNSPVSIYELNLTSWHKHPDGNFYTYEQLAESLVPYVKEMGYTHVQMMPVTEYPFDLSWGYQVTGYFSATSRMGTPHGLMALINAFHRENIGVLLDWVPAHFPKDEHALYRFDGTYCYEYAHDQKRENPDWGTHQFDYGRPEVESFLVSSASFWLDKFHVDGLRVDAVAAMLYLDYSRGPGQWSANAYGGNQNLEAVALLQKLNAHLFGVFPGIMMIAEESTSWPGVTAPVDQGGLGFNYKWNMGWMNDTLRYFETPTIYRKYCHSLLSHTFIFAFSENYILPISHDEVVYGKKALIDKMPGDQWQQFANVRLFLCYMMAYPGKKLLFMGSEFGQYDEWDATRELPFSYLQYESHSTLKNFAAALNQFYRSTPALYENERSEGFEWISWDDTDNQILAFVRRDLNGAELICVLNFSPTVHHAYRIGVPHGGMYQEVFNSDDLLCMGSGVSNAPTATREEPCHMFAQSLSLSLPPLGAIFLRRE